MEASSLPRPRLAITWLAAALGVGAGCASLVDESSRPCPCSDGYVCCAGACVPAGGACTDAANAMGPDTGEDAAHSDSAAPDGLALEGAVDAGPAVDAGAAADARDFESGIDSSASDAADGALAWDAPAPASDAASGDAGDAEAAMACSGLPLPTPRVHFTFADCSDAGIVRDTAGAAVGVVEGSGVQCDQSPAGGALRFGGADDAGGGSYVRVVDSLDAGAPACAGGEAGACPADWRFGNAITVAAWIDMPNNGSYENILGQWYVRDSYIFNTFYDSALGQQIFRFSVQAAGAAQPVNVDTPLIPAGGQGLSSWSHWVGVYDGRHASLYQDGQLAATQTVDGGVSALQCTSVPLELGAVGRNGPCADLNDSYFTGSIGDVQIFDVALTANQVQELTCNTERIAR